MSRHFALATRSSDKAREVRLILGSPGPVAFLSLQDLDLRPAPEEDDIETFHTFRENAAAKARFFARLTRLPTVADDSGLVVPVLGGDPGVRSKRFADRPDLAGPMLDRANNQRLLDRLRNVPPERRSAFYVCAAALALPDDHVPPRIVVGTCSGIIAPGPRGSGGFGYDPLFLVPDLGQTFGELPPAEKNRRSHRARAFRALAAHLVSSPPGIDPSRPFR